MEGNGEDPVSRADIQDPPTRSGHRRQGSNNPLMIPGVVHPELIPPCVSIPEFNGCNPLAYGLLHRDLLVSSHQPFLQHVRLFIIGRHRQIRGLCTGERIKKPRRVLASEGHRTSVVRNFVRIKKPQRKGLLTSNLRGLINDFFNNRIYFSCQEILEISVKKNFY